MPCFSGFRRQVELKSFYAAAQRSRPSLSRRGPKVTSHARVSRARHPEVTSHAPLSRGRRPKVTSHALLSRGRRPKVTPVFPEPDTQKSQVTPRFPEPDAAEVQGLGFKLVGKGLRGSEVWSVCAQECPVLPFLPFPCSSTVPCVSPASPGTPGPLSRPRCSLPSSSTSSSTSAGRV